MATQPMNTVITAEQLMLAKMDTMRAKVEPEFVVNVNPLDNQQVNAPISFSAAMTHVLDIVDGHQAQANEKMTAVETGKSDDLVGAMIASQKASLSFDALLQVRNKIVSSFEDIMKISV